MNVHKMSRVQEKMMANHNGSHVRVSKGWVVSGKFAKVGEVAIGIPELLLPSSATSGV